MSKKTEEMLATEQAKQIEADQPQRPSKEQLEEIRKVLMIPALPPLTIYSPSVQIQRLEEKVNEIAMKFNTLVNMITGADTK